MPLLKRPDLPFGALSQYESEQSVHLKYESPTTLNLIQVGTCGTALEKNTTIMKFFNVTKVHLAHREHTENRRKGFDIYTGWGSHDEACHYISGGAGCSFIHH